MHEEKINSALSFFLLIVLDSNMTCSPSNGPGSKVMAYYKARLDLLLLKMVPDYLRSYWVCFMTSSNNTPKNTASNNALTWVASNWGKKPNLCVKGINQHNSMLRS